MGRHPIAQSFFSNTPRGLLKRRLPMRPPPRAGGHLQHLSPPERARHSQQVRGFSRGQGVPRTLFSRFPGYSVSCLTGSHTLTAFAMRVQSQLDQEQGPSAQVSCVTPHYFPSISRRVDNLEVTTNGRFFQVRNLYAGVSMNASTSFSPNFWSVPIRHFPPPPRCPRTPRWVPNCSRLSVGNRGSRVIFLFACLDTKGTSPRFAPGCWAGKRPWWGRDGGLHGLPAVLDREPAGPGPVSAVPLFFPTAAPHFPAHPRHRCPNRLRLTCRPSHILFPMKPVLPIDILNENFLSNALFY